MDAPRRLTAACGLDPAGRKPIETAMMIPRPQTDRRRPPRALVCASALLMTEGNTATEHMVYDLSAGGVRLCGLPRAQVGDEVRVRFQFPRAQACAWGRLLRRGWANGSPDFAIEFFNVSADAEDAIHDAVVDALSQLNCRSLLLVQREGGWPACFDWLEAVSPICATAITSLGAVQCLEEHPIEMGILSTAGRGVRDFEWSEAHPEISWRTIDDAGRLHPLTCLH